MKERIVLNDHAKKSIRSIHQSVVFLVKKYIFVEVQFESTNNAIFSRRISLRWILREVSRYRRVSPPNLKHIITAIKFSLEARWATITQSLCQAAPTVDFFGGFFSCAEGRCCSALKWIIYNIKTFKAFNSTCDESKLVFAAAVLQWRIGSSPHFHSNA